MILLCPFLTFLRALRLLSIRGQSDAYFVLDNYWTIAA